MQRIGPKAVVVGTAVAVGCALWFSGCMGTSQQAILPKILTDKVAGAHAVGSETCANCHQSRTDSSTEICKTEGFHSTKPP